MAGGSPTYLVRAGAWPDAPPRHGGDQRHALCGRDAGAFDRVHGHRPAAHRGRAGGPAQDKSARRWARTASRLSITVRQATASSSCKRNRWRKTALVDRLHRHQRSNGYNQRIFVRGDDPGQLRQGDGSDGHPGRQPASPISDWSPMSQSPSPTRNKVAAKTSLRRLQPTTARGPTLFGVVASTLFHGHDFRRGAFQLPSAVSTHAEGQPCGAGRPGDHCRQVTNVAAHGAARAGAAKDGHAQAAGRWSRPRSPSLAEVEPAPESRPSPISRSPRKRPKDRMEKPKPPPRRRRPKDFNSPAQQAHRAGQAGEERQGGPAGDPGHRHRAI